MKTSMLKPLPPHPEDGPVEDFQRQFYEYGYTVGLPHGPRTLRSRLFPSVSRNDIAISLLSSGERVLDVGCGAGDLLECAAPKYSQLFGVDISRNRTEEARARLASLNRQVDLRALNIDQQDLPFESGYFNAVTMIAVLPFIFRIDHALSEIARVLKPNGEFILQTNNLGFIGHRFSVMLRGELRTSYFYGWDGNTLHYFSQGTLSPVLKSFGFHIKRISTSGRMQRLRAIWPSLWGGDLIFQANKM